MPVWAGNKTAGKDPHSIIHNISAILDGVTPTVNGVNLQGDRMSKYEELMNKAIECYNKAGETNDVNLKKFYFNASEGYKIKAAKLTVKEAGEQA